MNLLKLTSEFDEVYNRNVDSIYKICFLYLKDKSDVEDFVQNTFIKYLRYKPVFENLDHEKFWFIKTATNLCKNHFKSWYKKNIVLDDQFEVPFSDNDKDILEIILSLPVKYKYLIYLHFYEGYKLNEIAKIFNKNESSLRTDFSKAKKILKERMGSDYEKL